MSEDILKELNVELLREVFQKYTLRAFNLLPKMIKPRILDAGCGTGAAILELARHSDAEFFGIDVDQAALDEFKAKIEKLKLSSRIKIFNRSIYDMKFSNHIFDIVWDEGVMHLLDIHKALEEFSRFLKSNGYLVALETIKWFKSNLSSFSKYGFKILSQFNLPDECWWREYYIPMEEKIKQLRFKYKGSKELKKLKKYESEINIVRKNPKEFDCAFYIFKKSKIKEEKKFERDKSCRSNNSQPKKY
ncbi:MAG: class I SAM-dependent methyltransferase [Promethearchaeota archaeon]